MKMETTIGAALRQAVPAKATPPRTAVFTKERENDLKRLFFRCGCVVTKDFKITNGDRGLYNDIFQWCIRNPEGKLDIDKGLLLWGNIGVGKTTILKIVREFCRIPGIRPPKRIGISIGAPYSFAIKSVHEILSKYQERPSSLDSYADCAYLAIDDIGAETKEVNRYGTIKNVIDELLQRRYDKFCADKEFTTHLTANISKEKIKDHYSERTYDRCKEMFNFIEIRGNSWRN